jgi:hypothetical protein
MATGRGDRPATKQLYGAPQPTTLPPSRALASVGRLAGGSSPTHRCPRRGDSTTGAGGVETQPPIWWFCRHASGRGGSVATPMRTAAVSRGRHDGDLFVEPSHVPAVERHAGSRATTRGRATNGRRVRCEAATRCHTHSLAQRRGCPRGAVQAVRPPSGCGAPILAVAARRRAS